MIGYVKHFDSNKTISFNPIQDGWGAKRPPATSFSHVTSTNIEIGP